MNYSNIKYIDAANGPGCRTSVFVSGCRLHCKGCFNDSAWDFKAGEFFDENTISKIIESLRPEYIDGLSILGGEPLDVQNRHTVGCLINEVRKEFKDSKNIWLWTGYKWENLINELVKYSNRWNDLGFILRNIDVLVDGPFEEDKKELGLRFRGSSNQRIIDVQKTLYEPKLWEDDPQYADHQWVNEIVGTIDISSLPVEVSEKTDNDNEAA